VDQSPIYNSLEDEDLVTHARDGDAAAYDELVTRYRGKIYSVVYGMVRNEEDAWDLAQDGFLKAWKNLENFRGQSKFYTWLYRIVTNMTIDWLRRKKNQPAAEFDDTVRSADFEPGAATAPKSAVNPRKAAQHGELGGRIEEAIESLSPAHKAVVTLHMIEGFQYNEIAEMLDISLGTVMSRLFYARKKLQHALQDIYEDL
jgi:RNA polymerase sigma-70 factor (ECF subfamily)